MNDFGQPQVFLVGAGPGDPGLLTLRGHELLSQADVILYDNLVAPELLQFAGEAAEKIYVGKRAGRHQYSQEEINALLIEHGKKGVIVVRLKGGDPCIFGRGGEEALALKQAQIPFEIVPGITAGIAACSYAGIPITHRNMASDVAFITGHEDITRIDDSQIDWKALAAWRGTIVFYMAVTKIEAICQRLMDYGMDKKTPAAIISWATTPKQMTCSASLDDLSQVVKDNNIRPPAIIVIGKVAALRDDLSWFESRPLLGKTVVVTRARRQASELTKQLKYLGAHVLETPTIKIAPPDNLEKIQQAFEKLMDYDWIVFTSTNGVEAFFKYLFLYQLDGRDLVKNKIAAVGTTTSQALLNYGISADLVPETFTSAAIVEALRQSDDIQGLRYLLPRTNIAPKELPDALKEHGGRVDDVVFYQTQPDFQHQSLLEKYLDQDRIDWIVFTSSSTVKNFTDQISLKNYSSNKYQIASIGPQTTTTLSKAEINNVVEAQEHTIHGLIKTILSY